MELWEQFSMYKEFPRVLVVELVALESEPSTFEVNYGKAMPRLMTKYDASF